MNRILSLTLLALALLIALPACNTVSGVGQDVQAAGKGIERTAEKVKREL